MRLAILAVGAAFVSSLVASASTYLVRPDGLGDFPFIQDAINAAVNGDVIELTSGIFSGPRNWNLDYSGKAITIRAQGGPGSVCIIDCWGMARGVIFQSGEGPESRLEDVTIINGHTIQDGGACVVTGASPTFIGCEFSYSTAYGGAGVSCVNGSPTFARCVFRGNTGTGQTSPEGGGIYVAGDGDVSMTDCVFDGNTAVYGGAASVYMEATFTQCVFSDNTCGTNGAAVYGGPVTLTDCTFFGNTSYSGLSGTLGGGPFLLRNTIVAFSAVHARGVFGEATLECCDIFGNAGGDWIGNIAGQYGVNGNICLDPQFCDTSGGFTLEADSPCGPDFNPDCGLIGAFGIGCADAASIPDPPADDPTATTTTWGGLKAIFR
jgi:predicted outer membrane repeat protein